jgi:hypothetical protein
VLDDTSKSNEPMDKLTRIGSRILDRLVMDEEYTPDIKAQVFILDKRGGGIGLHGYGADGDMDAFVDLFVHMKAILNANGKDMTVIPLRKG